MITEGVGRKAPQKIGVSMTFEERRQLFACAKARAEHRGYKARGDQWGQGLKGAITLPGIGELNGAERAIYVGLCGEYAVQRFVASRLPLGHQCQVDTRLLKGGDFGIDLTAYGIKMQVKTRQRQQSFLLYKRANRNGYRFSIPAHVCVVCEWTEPAASTWLCGWMWSTDVAALSLVESEVGDWWNAVIHDADLQPMSALRDEIDAWRQLRQCR